MKLKEIIAVDANGQEKIFDGERFDLEGLVVDFTRGIYNNCMIVDTKTREAVSGIQKVIYAELEKEKHG